MAFLVGGGAATVVTIGCAVLGGLCGVVRRRGGGAGTIALVAAGLAPIAAAGAVAVLFVFAAARDLAFASLRATASGVLQVAAQLGLPTSLTDGVLRLVDTLLAFWPAVVAVVVAVAVVVGMLATHLVVSAVSRRVEWLADDDPLDDATRREEASVAPLPLVFEGVGYRHPGAAQQAVSDLDLHIEPGEFVAVVGPNGAGKSTLVALLAGARAESGRVRRPGAVGLGRPGGTFVLAQRADSQVIASTVAEELRWGLPPEVSVDVEALLGDVGLHGLASAGTDTLSGGQLQRLAIAGALARRPALLISDESTSMLDAEGRRDVLDLLAALPARTGTAVVHVTHDPAEAARAHRVIGMRGGRLVDADASGGPVPSEPPLTIGQVDPRLGDGRAAAADFGRGSRRRRARRRRRGRRGTVVPARAAPAPAADGGRGHPRRLRAGR